MSREVFNFDQVILPLGAFKADDIFGAALCRLLNPKIKIIQTKDPEKAVQMARNIDERVLLYNEWNLKRLWDYYGPCLCNTPETYSDIYEDLIRHLAGYLHPGNILSFAIEQLNLLPGSNESEVIAFHRAVNIAVILLKAAIDQANARNA